MVRKTIVSSLVTLAVFTVAVLLGVYYGVDLRSHTLESSGGVYPKCAVATVTGLCSEIGRDILVKGGSAVDAAIAALLCLGLVNAHSMGIGGGLFFTIYNATTGKVETINARERAPLNATQDMYGGNTDLVRQGGLSIAVPGEIRGYEMAHRRHGRLPWRELFQPSIRLARDGFPVTRALAKAIDENKEIIQANVSLCKVFCDKNKQPLKENDTIQFIALADTYEKIANEGPDAFYTGKMAENIVKDIQDAGGIITVEDLQAYTPVLDESPVKTDVGDYTMWVPDAPSGGPVLALILNILEGYNFTGESVSTTEKQVLTYHRVIESFRFAFAKRNKLGDPLFISKNDNDFITNMTSKAFAEKLHRKITDDTTHPQSYYEPEYSTPDNHGTSHISVVAEDGSAVAATSTINHYFGSKVLSRRTGIIFNNEMDDFGSPNITNYFDVPPSPNNYIKPGKRPLSSMCPVIFLDKEGKVKMVTGGAGGTRIVTAVTQVVLNSLFFDYSLKKAVEAPRLHNQLNPNRTLPEAGFDQRVLEGLVQKQHIIDAEEFEEATIQAILWREGVLYAESDPRKGGYPAGY